MAVELERYCAAHRPGAPAEQVLSGGAARMTRAEAGLLALMRKKYGIGQDVVATMFGTGMGGADELMRTADGLVGAVLPSAEAVREKIAAGDAGTVSEMVPGGQIVIDMVSTPLARRADAGGGARQAATTIMIANRDGLIIYAGEPCAGCGSRLDQLRADDPDLGRITGSMKGAAGAAGRRITVYVDREWSGIEGLYPGALVRYPEGAGSVQEPARRKKARHRAAGGAGEIIGGAMRGIRQFAMLGGPYEDPTEELGREIQIATGLANHRVLWDEAAGRYAHGL